jgi:3-phosphoinositide dependent protein kinase-1
LGCIIYQLITNKHPFTGASNYLIFQQILNRQLTFPSNFPSVAKDLVDKLLQLKPEDRLGAGPGGYEKLKAHPFFTGIQWDKLHIITPPPIKPQEAPKQSNGGSVKVQIDPVW